MRSQEASFKKSIEQTRLEIEDQKLRPAEVVTESKATEDVDMTIEEVKGESEIKPIGVSTELKLKFEQLAEKLIQERKGTKPPPQYTSKREIQEFKESLSLALKHNPSKIQVSANKTILLPTSKTQIAMLDKEFKQTHKCEAKGDASFVPFSPHQIFVTGRESGIIDMKTERYTYRVKCHANVTCVSFQPIGDFLVVGSDDCSWSFHDVHNEKLLTKVSTEAPITSIEFHPDGLVLGVGLANGKVIIYDIRTQERAIELQSASEEEAPG